MGETAMSVSRFIGVPLVLALTTGAALAADERVERLPEVYREWLEEEVVYIITKREKNVFLDLTTIQERDRFIESFWDRRDTDRATLQNEFKVEHYRRLDYANTVLARDAPRAGWRTDRGEYYIILGKPLEIQRYDGEADVVGIEIWFYMGDAKYGLPGRFNLMFFKGERHRRVHALSSSGRRPRKTPARRLRAPALSGKPKYRCGHPRGLVHRFGAGLSDHRLDGGDVAVSQLP